MARAHRYLNALALWLLGGAAALAQAAAPPERQLNFTVFSALPVDNLAYVPRLGAAPVPLVFYPTARSPYYAYAGSASLQFLDARAGIVAAEIGVPSKIRTALFILFPRASLSDGSVRCTAQVIDDGAEMHAAGTLRIINLSGLELSGTINQRRVTLQAGTNAPIRVDGPAAITLRTPFKNRSYQACAELIRLGKADRALLLLLPPYRPGSLEVQSRILLDTPAPEPGKNTAD